MLPRNRAGVKRRLAELADAACHSLGVQVAYGWPGDTVEDSTMYFAGVEGNDDVDGFSVGEQLKSDRFTIPALVAVTPYFDPVDAEEAVEAVVREFDAVLRRCKRLRDTEATIDDGDTDSYAGVRSAVITRAQGPYVSYAQPTPNAPIIGLYQLDIECVSDL